MEHSDLFTLQSQSTDCDGLLVDSFEQSREAQTKMGSASRLLLIVDDFKGVQYAYQYLLAREGFRVAFAMSGQEAVDKALALQPDVIFMDFSLPVFDGCDATRRLRADERTKRIPVVLLTAFGLESALPYVADAGFDGLLSKPCTPQKMHAEVDRVLACR